LHPQHLGLHEIANVNEREAAWNIAAAAIIEANRVEAENKVRATFNVPGTSVAEGMEVLSDGKWVRPYGVNIPPKQITNEGIIAGMQTAKKPVKQTVADIKESVRRLSVGRDPELAKLISDTERRAEAERPKHSHRPMGF